MCHSDSTHGRTISTTAVASAVAFGDQQSAAVLVAFPAFALLVVCQAIPTDNTAVVANRRRASRHVSTKVVTCVVERPVELVHQAPCQVHPEDHQKHVGGKDLSAQKEYMLLVG